MNAGMKHMVILNKHDTTGSISDLIVTTAVCILAIVQETFEKFTGTMCLIEDPGSQKYEVFSNLFSQNKSLNTKYFCDPEVFFNSYGTGDFFQIFLGLSPRHLKKQSQLDLLYSHLYHFYLK